MPRTAMLAAALGLAAVCAHGAWIVRPDAEATRIRFSVGATLHRVEGSARLTDGELRIDRASGEASGELVVDARSVTTDHAKRDRQMHAKVLESEAYPEIRFRLQRLSGELAAEGASELILHGEIAIHGGAHPVSLPVTVEIESGRLRGETRFSVPYVEWGLTDPSRFVLRVEKSVEVVIELVATVEAGAVAAEAPHRREEG